MLINDEKDKKIPFFYLFLVDFLIAAQFVALSVFFWGNGGKLPAAFLENFLIAFAVSFLTFSFFSSVWKNRIEAEKVTRQGLVIFLLSNLSGILFFQDNFLALGNILFGFSSGMILLGQAGTIWALEKDRSKEFSFWLVLFSSAGFLFGPNLLNFLSGPDLALDKTSFVLSSAIIFLALIFSRSVAGELFSIFSFIMIDMPRYIKNKRRKLAMFWRKKRKRQAIAEIVREKLWISIKFLMLFAIVTWFASQSFSVEISLVIALGITLLSVAYNQIFDSASDAFLDVEEDDEAQDKAKKTITVILKRVFYTFLDYGLAALSVALVVAAINLKFSFWTAVAAMWLIIDLPSAAILVGIYEKTGRDMTLGRSYRRMARSIYGQSKSAGTVVYAYETILASFWSGPDFTIIFFKDELKTRAKTIAALIVITIIHSLLWTSVYWYGYEDVTELVTKIF